MYIKLTKSPNNVNQANEKPKNVYQANEKVMNQKTKASLYMNATI